LAAETDPPFLTFMRRAELLRASVGDALERAAVLVVLALGVLGAAPETKLVGAWAARSGNALLGVGARSRETYPQAFPVDT